MKKKKAFKERKQLKKHTDSSDTGSKDNKTSDWTKPKHLSKTDQDDLKTVKKLYENGKYHEAGEYACSLPAKVSKEIPGLIWKEIGGEFTLIKREQLHKEQNKTKHQNSEKFSNRPDALNPKYIFQSTSTQLLIEALKNEFDLEYCVRKELANRGLDRDGEWVGFSKAKEIHQVEW